jgi:SAM-dependent methyltransferase
MLTRLRGALQRHGPVGLLARIWRRVLPRKARCHQAVAALVAGRRGLEIGGPSGIFTRGLLPVYGVVGDLDNSNYASATFWEGTIEAGRTFRFDPRRAAGQQFIAEATDLRSVPSDHYELVLSSHVLEHSSNPLRALAEWTRVLEPQGILVLVVPHKQGTFDHRRPVTTLAHLIEDWTAGTAEDDLTHLPEILELHDVSLDPGAGDLAAFTARSRNNRENRCLHHHVFDTQLVVEVVHHAGLQIVTVEPHEPFHIIVVARKPRERTDVNNAAFRGPAAVHRRTSPFTADRAAPRG